MTEPEDSHLHCNNCGAHIYFPERGIEMKKARYNMRPRR